MIGIPPGTASAGETAGFEAGSASDESAAFATTASTSPSLADRAQFDARGWISAPRKPAASLLQEKQDCCERLLVRQECSHDVGALADSTDLPPLVRHRRLIMSAWKNVQETLRSPQLVPQVSVPGDASTAVPRAYAVARAFFSSNRFVFCEEDLRTFVVALQQLFPLEMNEIWLLKPMMQLVLLEAIEDGITSPPGIAPSEQLSVPLISLQQLGVTSFADQFLSLSHTEAILQQDPAGFYSRMDSESRELYRASVSDLAANSEADEFTVARTAIHFATEAHKQAFSDPRVAERRSHVGYYLWDKGQGALKERIHYRSRGARRLRELLRQVPEVFYFLGAELLTFAIMAFILGGIPVGPPLLAGIFLLLLPASESAIEVVNQLVTFFLPPRRLPRLDFSEGIPAESATVVAIPALLIDEQQIRELVRNVEIRYVGNRDPNLYFVLLTDPPDSSERFDQRDQHVSLCSSLIEDLNRKYARDGVAPFLHLHRHRVFNEIENKWMGWERKRGKLLDFNDFLRGSHERFPVKVGDLSVLPRIRYVITLDADTQLPRDSAQRLVGTIAHPLNRAQVNPQTNIVEQGYGIVQPSVGVSVQSANRSRLAYIYSGQTGLDTYTRAVSNVYQDLFGEGSFTGKGIYEVDVFRHVLHDRFPKNVILSHDLIEGAYARTGFVSDIEVIDDYPSHLSAHSRRKHRWIRGDWQIMRWLWPSVPDAHGQSVKNPLSLVSRWKILDNLRRSVIEAATFVLLVAAWFFLRSPGYWTAATVALLLIPSYVQLVFSFSRAANSDHPRSHVQQALHDFVSSQINVFVFLAFLAHQTLVTLDAVFRTIVRLAITRRNLLEWETAAQSEMEVRRKTPVDVYLDWIPYLALTLAALIVVLRPAALPAALPILTLWFFAKPAARWLDHPLRSKKSAISADDERFLRIAALKTWRFFRQLSSPDGNFLIPDNLYEENWVVAHRLSPTNLGLQLNAQYAAFDLGFVTLDRFTADTERVLASAKRLPRYRGHFLNWYTTTDLQPDGQPFVSSVDSGNLACSLLALKQGCLRAVDEPVFRARISQGLLDHLDAAIAALGESRDSHGLRTALEVTRLQAAGLGNDPVAWSSAAQNLSAQVQLALQNLHGDDDTANHARWWISQSLAHLQDIQNVSQSLAPWTLPEFASLRAQVGELLDLSVISTLTLRQLPGFIARLQKKLAEYSFWRAEEGAKDALNVRLHDAATSADELLSRLDALAAFADAMVHEMDFRFLYDKKRKMLSIGFNVEANRLEASCYDLLASEARSAVFVAIAKGDIRQESWFQLTRTHTEAFGLHVLLSWTGTMFEYLMPTLWMKTFPESLLENSTNGAVASQRAKIANLNRVNSLNIPWGISESARSSRNNVGHYDYRAFGLSELALNPELDPAVVIAPYATFLALNTDAQNAMQNLRRLEALGTLGPFGFYESIDFGNPRTAIAQLKPEIVRSWMAHHQGMSLLSICNFLSDGIFQRLFHSDIMVASTERVLHERRPIFSSAARNTRAERKLNLPAATPMDLDSLPASQLPPA